MPYLFFEDYSTSIYSGMSFPLHYCAIQSPISHLAVLLTASTVGLILSSMLILWLELIIFGLFSLSMLPSSTSERLGLFGAFVTLQGLFLPFLVALLILLFRVLELWWDHSPLSIQKALRAVLLKLESFFLTCLPLRTRAWWVGRPFASTCELSEYIHCREQC